MLTIIDPRIAEWARLRIGVPSWMGSYTAMGFIEAEQIQGAVVYDGFTQFECNMHVAVDNWRHIRRTCLRAAFQYPFETLKLRRVTGLVDSAHPDALKFFERLGFCIEGEKKDATETGNEIILGLTRDQCKWLR